MPKSKQAEEGGKRGGCRSRGRAASGKVVRGKESHHRGQGGAPGIEGQPRGGEVCAWPSIGVETQVR